MLYIGVEIFILNLFTKPHLDPTYWEYEGAHAHAKFVGYYPRNELKLLWEEPFT